jgi:hypothetical protein
MRVARLVLSFILIASSPLELSSQQTSVVPQRDPQAIAILQQSFATMGGPNLGSIHDTRITVQAWTSQDTTAPPFPATIITQGNSHLRVDSQSPQGTISFAITDTSAASLEPGQPVEVQPRASFGTTTITHLPIFTLQSQLNNISATVKYVGLEQDEASTVHHIRIQQPLNPAAGLGNLDVPIEFFINSQTLLPAKLIYGIRAPSNLATVSLVQAQYTDYRPVAGILAPFTVRYSTDGSFLNEQHVITFNVNVGATDANFELR